MPLIQVDKEEAEVSVLACEKCGKTFKADHFAWLVADNTPAGQHLECQKCHIKEDTPFVGSPVTWENGNFSGIVARHTDKTLGAFIAAGKKFAYIAAIWADSLCWDGIDPMSVEVCFVLPDDEDELTIVPTWQGAKQTHCVDGYDPFISWGSLRDIPNSAD